MGIQVSVTDDGNNQWTITSTGSATAPGIIAVTPTLGLGHVQAFIKFASAVTEGTNPASTGPYAISIPTSFTAPTAGSYDISASQTENGDYCTAHPIIVGRGGTGGS